MPSNSAIAIMGKGLASAAMASISLDPSVLLNSSPAICRMRGSSSLIRRGVKALLTSLRSLVCTGGSAVAIVGASNGSILTQRDFWSRGGKPLVIAQHNDNFRIARNQSCRQELIELPRRSVQLGDVVWIGIGPKLGFKWIEEEIRRRHWRLRQVNQYRGTTGIGNEPDGVRAPSPLRDRSHSFDNGFGARERRSGWRRISQRPGSEWCALKQLDRESGTSRSRRCVKVDGGF